MTDIRKSRSVARAMFTKTANELEKLLTAEMIDLEETRVKWRIFSEKFEALKFADTEYLNKMLESDSEEAIILEATKADEYSATYLRLEQRYNRCFQDDVCQKSVAGTEFIMPIASRKFKLPTIEFKKFGGDIRDWLPFWGQFQKIHCDPQIPLEDKFQYLLQTTTVGSRARAVVESFPPTKENYQKALDSLRTRFGREDLLVEVYVRELLKLVLHNTLSHEKCGLSILYDKIETQLRALESLGVTSDKCVAMLYPLVESCLPEELLRAWQRSSVANECEDKSTDRLKDVMNFLKREVEGEERIALAIEGFGISSLEKKQKFRTKPQESHVPTAASLLNSGGRNCSFCGKSNHVSMDCFKAQKMGLQEKRKTLMKQKACYSCLKIGHLSSKCRERVRCIACSGRHVTLMCPDLPSNKEENSNKQELRAEQDSEQPQPGTEKNLANYTNTPVFLQTLRVLLRSEKTQREVRAVIDTGSQRTYILKATAEALNYSSKRQETLIHALFGGSSSTQQKHKCYDIQLVSLDGEYSCKIEALDQPVICGNIPPVYHGCWTQELQDCNILLTDIRSADSIELLIGADVSGKLLSGRTQILQCGLVAVHTLLGWTLMGRISEEFNNSNNVTRINLSLLCNDKIITELWKLEAIGISDPIERKSKQEAEEAVREYFQQTVEQDSTGRYEVQLPWREGHPPIPRNEKMAKVRLQNTVIRLKREGYYEEYQKVFEDWLQERIIEEVPLEEISNLAHYLPHRAVIKPSSLTTKIRPVYDASAHEKGTPSLNDCLETGENLIELIPRVLIKFRLFRYGVVADIRKAFLQIGIAKRDRDYLRFLWMKKDGSLLHMRHRRVVFGLCCSPFLLGATLQYHLKKMLAACSPDDLLTINTIQKLLESFYVDNCLVSVADEQEAQNFKLIASQITVAGQFELRSWEMTQIDGVEETSLLLGIKWDKVADTLSHNYDNTDEQKLARITKRQALSIAQKIFDPIGHLSPVLLAPKLLLQKTWDLKINWDEDVPDDIEAEFRRWYADLSILKKIKIPRWVNGIPGEQNQWSLHTFVDASKEAYAAATFLRISSENQVHVHLLQAKARVSPLKKMTIPRLELLAATIGARLHDYVKNALDVKDIQSYFWSDSSTVLSWIECDEQWGTFVWNRVQEIRSLTSKEDWRHIPGLLNPADLPSRGCSPKQLVESKWWEGPAWLRLESNQWPVSHIEMNKEEVYAERKKMVVSVLDLNNEDNMRFYKYFSSYDKTVRMLAWIHRFSHNVKKLNGKINGELTSLEYLQGEKSLIRIVQQESFNTETSKQLRSLDIFKDEEEILRVKTQVSNRDDTTNFRFPIVLPANHVVVERLIRKYHLEFCHVGVQGLISKLREKYWILGGRKPIRSVIRRCVTCRKQTAKQVQVNSPPLVVDRVRNAKLFEVTGIDFAGPVYLNTKQKAWICLFTCAVYRAVHLELVTSLSTSSFLQCFRRFIARRGRPKSVYTDNGTNFVGSKNAFDKLDWAIIQQYSSVRQIEWRFNPPTAAWWGGWWERLVGLLKQLLRRVLGRACLGYEELLTVLCDCESVINNRPLTYVNRVRHLKKVRDDLRRRFRIEYLGLLRQASRRKDSDPIVLNEIVLVGNDLNKRLNWPLGRVIELLPGQDSKVRVARIQTSRGILLRPVQRLYPLECRQSTKEAEDDPTATMKSTRSAEVAEVATTISPKEENDVRVTRSGRRIVLH